MFIRNAFFLAAAAVAGSATAQEVMPLESALGELGPKIVGGSAADAGENRWITSIQYAGEHFCGGSLIAPTWVLTAAHCLVSESASDNALTVWVGGYNLNQASQGVRRDVKRIISHGQYDDFTLANDIALLELSSPVNLPVTTLANGAIMQGPAAPGQPVTASGWGALSEDGGFPNRLHEVAVPVVSNNVCNRNVSYGGDILSTMMCAGLQQGGKDSCSGDSGGPLWLNQNGVDVQVGVVSWGEGCALPDKYGVYTRVASFRSWVEARTGALPDPDNGGGGTTPPTECDPDTAAPGPVMMTACQPLTRGVWITQQRHNKLSGAAGEYHEFVINLAGGALRADFRTTGGSGDVDIYVARGRPATPTDFDFSATGVGTKETVKVNNPGGGQWYFRLVGAGSYSNVHATFIEWRK